MTTLTITPDVAKKKLKLAGTVASGEKVAVTVAGFGTVSTTNLRLRVMAGDVPVGYFPLEDEDEWTVSGSDLTCTLDLATWQAERHCKFGAEVCFILEDTGTPQLYGVGGFSLRPWIKLTGVDVPKNLDNYKVQMTAVLAELNRIETLANEKYEKPSGGIPSSDMSLAVQTSLAKADTVTMKVSKSAFDSLLGLSLPDTATQKDTRIIVQRILGVLQSAATCIALMFALPSFGIDTTTAWEDVPPQTPVKSVVEQFSPPADFSTNNADLVETIETKAPAPGDYLNVSNRAMSAVQEETDPNFNSFTNSGGIMYGPLKLWNSLGGGYDMSTVISSNGVSFWKFMPASGGGGVWVSGSFGWNDLLTSESDPTVPSWAKSSSKPTYTATEVGALASSTTHLSGDVPTSRKVNNKALSTDITLSASDVGAYSETDGSSLANIVNSWEGYWGGTNVIFEVTNYYGNVSGQLPRLRVKELRDSVWQTVWDEANKFEVCETNILTNVEQRVGTAIRDLKDYASENFSPKAWGTMTDKGTTNVVGNSVWMTSPETYFAGGTEYQRVAVGSGAVCVLVDNGANTYTAGEAGTFRFQDEGGTNFFGFAKSDSYTIGCRTDDISVDGNLVTLRYDVIMGGTDVPVVYWRLSLGSGEWTQLNNSDGTAASGAPYTVTWYQSNGSYYAAINCGSNPSGFFKAETSVAGDVVFETNMKARLGGGIECLNTQSGVTGVIRPTYNGSTVTWSWSAR